MCQQNFTAKIGFGINASLKKCNIIGEKESLLCQTCHSREKKKVYRHPFVLLTVTAATVNDIYIDLAIISDDF